MATIVISPSGVVNFPEGGGHFWVYAQYVHALQRLGCEVYWLERLYRTGDAEKDRSLAAGLRTRLQSWGLEGRVMLYSQSDPAGIEYVGISPESAEGVFRRADLLLNFNYRISPALLSLFRRTAMVDIDPGLLQFWIGMGQLLVHRHDLYFTTGETVGTSPLFPDCGIDWIYVRPPVCLDLWTYNHNAACQSFTTISSWWGGYGAGEWVTDGDSMVYENNKRVSFLQFVEAPRASGESLELALFMGDGDPVDQKVLTPPAWKAKKPTPRDITDYESDAKDRWILESYGWKIRSSIEVAGSPELYQQYIRASRGEFSCAKPSCMRLQNAWVSDRSLCYLASGKPVVVQDTGPSSFLPNGEGIFRFSTLDQVREAFACIRSDYRRHCQAARDIAESYFDARTCLEALLNSALSSS